MAERAHEHEERTPLLRSGTSGTTHTHISNRTASSPDSISIVVYILVIVFAWSSWIGINGVFVEFPVFVSELPESWKLPSYLIIVVQIANIGPVAFMLINKYVKIKEWPVVYVIIVVGAAASFLLMLFWDQTSVIIGKPHSTALLGLVLLISLVDCTSSVVFLPYMAYFKPQYMTAFYIGGGLCGVLPALMGLIQGEGSDPGCWNQTDIANETVMTPTNEPFGGLTPVNTSGRFSASFFFGFLFVMIVMSGVAFTLLHFFPYCRKEKVTQTSRGGDRFKTNLLRDDNSADFDADTNPEIQGPKTYDTSSNSAELSRRILEDQGLVTTIIENPQTITTVQFVYLLVVIMWVNAILNGIIPSIESYASKPYGNLTFTLSIRLATIANPLVSFLALFLKTRSVKVVSVLTAIATLLCGYHLFLAGMSPSPPLKQEMLGSVLVVVSQILLYASIAYVKVTCASVFNDHGGRRALQWCGVVTQIGGCLGAVTTFLLVNVFTVFQEEPPCSSP